jgi:UDP-3-O-[3-hydroxymyristoyl] glucosamine N-acyltransferase
MTGPGFDLQELAARFGLELRGAPATRIHGVGTLEGAGPGQLAFLANPAYRKQLPATRAGAVVLRAQDAGDSPVPCLVAKDPYAAFARLAALFEATPAAGARHPPERGGRAGRHDCRLGQHRSAVLRLGERAHRRRRRARPRLRGRR